MTNSAQHRSWIFKPIFQPATMAVVTIVLAITAGLTQAAQAQTFTVLHNFTGGEDGAAPKAGVTMDGAGNLYGTTYTGGGGYGTVYRLKRSGSNWVFSPLYSFGGGSDGANPSARVIFGPDGALYGTTEFGGTAGTVFKLQPSASACKAALCLWTETVLHNFQAGADGANPGYGDLLFDQAHDIYGTTIEGGAPHNAGTAYELTPAGSGYTESIIYSFGGGSDGVGPHNGLIFDSVGNLYGTTAQGGSSGDGTVFQLAWGGSGWTEGLLYSFSNGSAGVDPFAGLIFDKAGDLYGAASDGGTSGQGTAFELTLANGSWIYSVLYSFSAPPGGFQCGPYSTLVMDQARNLYGTTRCAGANGLGSVFKLTPSDGGWIYTALHDFTGGSDGGYPLSNVIFDTTGNFYGTASTGGSHGDGVVWEITP
jgi:uncharacterized repeat protein (TIGR03803 family)